MDALGYELLSLLTEDLYGPWEIAVQVPVPRSALTIAIQELAVAGLIEWFVRRRDSDTAVSVVGCTIDPPDLSLESTWAVPELGAQHFLLGATDAGGAAYFRSAGDFT